MEREKDMLMVSIRCATYNHVNYIRDCLSGFVKQRTNFRFEVIVHDDASTDGTTDIIREFVQLYPDIIKPMYETTNQYSTNVRDMNERINQRLVGKYIAICEGDDYWQDPLKLQKQVDALEENPDLTIAYCRVQRIRKDGTLMKGNTIPRANHFCEGRVTLNDFCNEEFYNGYWCFHTSSFLIRKELYDNTLERSEFYSMFPYGDMPAQLWCLVHGDGYFVDTIGSCYRIMSGGYNSYEKSHADYAISQLQKLINSLSYFDNYTNGKFSEAIKMRIMRAEIDICTYKGERLPLYRKKYMPIIKSKSFIGHCSYIVKEIFPTVHIVVKNLLCK
jgi:glycosyltransferase involved in cell wall biosynthesis